LQIYEGKSDAQKKITNWFFLTKAGYNTRLTSLADYVFAYVHSNENIFETPLTAKHLPTLAIFITRLEPMEHI
jgi:hypothetical protein